MAQVRNILADVKRIDTIETNVGQLQTEFNTFDPLPAQSGMGGKYLTTDGTVATWNTVAQPTLLSQFSNDVGYQTAAQVSASIAGVVNSAPEALNTLNELATALGNDANFAATVTNTLATKANLSGGTFTGNVAVNGLFEVKDPSDFNRGRMRVGTVGEGFPYVTIGMDLGGAVDAGRVDAWYFRALSYIDTPRLKINGNYGAANQIVYCNSASSIAFGNLKTVNGSSILGSGNISTNPFNQSLNTTDDAYFSYMYPTSGLHIRDGSLLLLSYSNGTSGQLAMSNGGNSPSWTDLKTVNGTSLLGSGDIAFPTTLSSFTNDSGYALTSNVNTALALKANINTPTFTGTASFDNNVVINGNLTVNGSQIITNTATMEVADPMIYIGTGNTGNSNDIGFVGHFTSGSYQHTGLVRDASDNKWRLFSGVTSEPSGSTLDFTSAVHDALQIGALTATTGTFSGNVTVAGTIDRAPVITLAGDLSGSVTLTDLRNGTLNATIVANAVQLGADTTGNYMIDVTAGTGVTVSHTPNEGSTATISIGQSVATTATPTFAGLSSGGGITPTTNAAYDLGSSTLAWRNVYTNDLHLSNEGHEEGNSVDGTKGNWTVQEGAEDLFIINNKTGKKYKFKLEEIQ